jgi:tRNA U34 5-methylaminomethyl-2-thiouridine-forming methyltransferase MnmC
LKNNLLFIIKISILITAFRWFVLYPFPESLTISFFAQSIHAFSFGLYHTAVIMYLYKLYSNKKLAQQFMLGFAYGLGGFIGAIISGMFYGEFLFLYSSIIAIFAFLSLNYKTIANPNVIITSDGSYTLYSKKFNQNYHSVKEGALNEALSKHVIPSLTYHKNKKELNILDICFGLGYNTLATLYYIKNNHLNIKINIYSPEFDKKLLDLLKNFNYPKEFEQFKNIITILSQKFYYEDENIKIEIFNGDAREYIKNLKNIDIVYQDAFSSDVNKMLWTQEYFQDIKSILNIDAIITTYSIATPVRLSIYNNNLKIYEYKPENSNKITIALNRKDIYQGSRYKYIDMELKQLRNKEAKAIID